MSRTVKGAILGTAVLAFAATAAGAGEWWSPGGPRHGEPSVFPRTEDPWQRWGELHRPERPQPRPWPRGDAGDRPVVWVPGQWIWNGYHWVWVPGHWRR
jgi:hypothetical protein